MNFNKVSNGYDPKTVDEYIKNQNDEILKLQNMLQKAAFTVSSAKEDLDVAKTRYETLSEELSLREKTATEINRIALKEASQVIEIANQNADLIVRQATSAARELLIEVHRISQETGQIKDELLEQAKLLYDVIDSLEVPIVEK